MYYSNIFIVYSIIGYIFESIIYLFNEGESGILYGPWTPVYGIGVVLLYLVFSFMKKKNFTRNQILVGEFFTGFFVLSFLEWIGGHLLEYFFHVVFWNYEGLLFHVGKYISLETAFVWSILSVLCIRFLKEPLDQWVKKIPKFVTFVLFFFFLIDCIFTLLYKMKLSVFFFPFF